MSFWTTDKQGSEQPSAAHLPTNHATQAEATTPTLKACVSPCSASCSAAEMARNDEKTAGYG
jgi:hypothetical protein